jgi:hypothetical protein
MYESDTRVAGTDGCMGGGEAMKDISAVLMGCVMLVIIGIAYYCLRPWYDNYTGVPEWVVARR